MPKIKGLAVNVIKLVPANWKPEFPLRSFAFVIPGTGWPEPPPKRVKLPKPGEGVRRRPDGAPSGHPVDDATSSALKAAFAIRAFDIYTMSKCVNRLIAAGGGGRNPTKRPLLINEIFRKFGFPAPSLERLLQVGAKQSAERELRCASSLRPRLPPNLAVELEAAGCLEYLFQALGAEADGLSLIVRAQRVIEQQITGIRTVARDIRRGVVATTDGASTKVLGSEEFQKRNTLEYVDKIRLSLYTSVNSSQIWLDTVNLGGPVPEHELFNIATLVGKLATGQPVTLSCNSAKVLLNMIYEEEVFIGLERNILTVPQLARQNVCQMLWTVFDESSLVSLRAAVQSGFAEVRIDPITPVGYESAMLSLIFSIA